jgi:hypothetical protein
MQKKEKIVLNFFIDAFGWELLQENPFLTDIAPYRHKLESIFGYSSACIPSILMGCPPQEHGYWTSFYYSPKTSPFKFLKKFSILPGIVMKRSKVRNQVDKYVKRKLNWKGYLSLYNFPFKHIGLFDYWERENFYEPGSTPKPTIFDHLVKENIPYFSFDQGMDEDFQFKKLEQHLKARDIRFSYLSLTQVDGKAHMNKRDSDTLKSQIKEYERRIKEIYLLAQENYEEVKLNIFSDHDMAPVKGAVDVIAKIEETDLKFNEDYVAVYDSTMARFWPLNERAEEVIKDTLQQIPEGTLVSDEEHKKMGTFYPDSRFGKLIFVLDEGALIVPSFMGEKAIPGMHGYLPHNKYSFSMCVTNQKYEKSLSRITDVYQLMKDSI